ncbi:MAG: pyridoxal 5-phosphate synthase pdxT subunit [Pseudonocardiales bacterium]|jgi:5'-phosphate synthase pdxT subunit|nr:pyridoxal 5-phosphate synthase pdxT subunit [Pseudonocardiales bacterium]
MSAAPVIGVLALQGDVREHLAMLTSVGARAMPVRRERELAAVDGLVIPGGESTTIVKLARHFDLFGPLHDRIAGGLPTYGSCAGMILLADRILDGTPDQTTFGGIDMTVRRNAFGRQIESFEEPVTVAGIDGGAVVAVFIRAPWVEEVGEQAQVLGRVESGPATGRIVAIRQQHLLATSFHPELTGDARVHEYFVTMVREGVPGAAAVSSREGGAA